MYIYMNDQSRQIMIKLWYSILRNNINDARNILIMNFLSVMIPAFTYLYGNIFYEKTNFTKSKRLIDFLNFVLSLQFFIPLIISLHDYYYNNFMSLIMLKTYIVAQMLSIPLYFYGYFTNTYKKIYDKKIHLIIILLLLFIYLIIFYVYLYYFSEIVILPTI